MQEAEAATLELKSKLRNIHHEVEEKNEIIVELKELLEQSKETCNKLRQENMDLVQEARAAKALRDEIDFLNERVRKLDRLETEVQRYKDRMGDMEFLKTRIDEVREENRLLSEGKAMLQEQLELARKRCERLPELEHQLIQVKALSLELQ
jgi:predicted RNase H-like nuclease (RuvC/YqgF family)